MFKEFYQSSEFSEFFIYEFNIIVFEFLKALIRRKFQRLEDYFANSYHVWKVSKKKKIINNFMFFFLYTEAGISPNFLYIYIFLN